MVDFKDQIVIDQKLLAEKIDGLVADVSKRLANEASSAETIERYLKHIKKVVLTDCRSCIGQPISSKIDKAELVAVAELYRRGSAYRPTRFSQRQDDPRCADMDAKSYYVAFYRNLVLGRHITLRELHAWDPKLYKTLRSSEFDFYQIQ